MLSAPAATAAARSYRERWFECVLPAAAADDDDDDDDDALRLWQLAVDTGLITSEEQVFTNASLMFSTR